VAWQHFHRVGLRTLHAASAGLSYKLDMHAVNAACNGMKLFLTLALPPT
jgi:hypothetical protein